MPEPGRIGKRGTVVIPAELRRRSGIAAGTLVIVESARTVFGSGHCRYDYFLQILHALSR